MKILTNKEKKEMIERREKEIIDQFKKNFDKIKRTNEAGEESKTEKHK